MGGAGAAYWRALKNNFNLDLTLFSDHADPSFSFMALDKDGAIRMDCIICRCNGQVLLALKDSFDLGLVTIPITTVTNCNARTGLMNPNHYLAVAIDYLCKHRDWSADKVIGKTLSLKCDY